ncbi:hypothetical protein BC936DRAFT_143202 [Jimgerdemannia flammicorona]|uniref:Uncharacterized protein n=1 Tax=Jimgerdemannia flammicorona TaxID=994334 RepID=A0A433DMV4_9FUNG|nr:hypothetical protein BC936DRAFT_143202 [Jimgerdemannia flammicorona]
MLDLHRLLVALGPQPVLHQLGAVKVGGRHGEGGAVHGYEGDVGRVGHGLWRWLVAEGRDLFRFRGPLGFARKLELGHCYERIERTEEIWFAVPPTHQLAMNLFFRILRHKHVRPRPHHSIPRPTPPSPIRHHGGQPRSHTTNPIHRPLLLPDSPLARQNHDAYTILHRRFTHTRLVAAYISPSHDSYVYVKLNKRNFIPVAHRVAIVRLATRSSDWIDVDA